MLNSRQKLSKKPTKLANAADLPLVEVVWLDAQIVPAHDGIVGEPLDEFGGLAECRDVGYLVRMNKRELVLCVSRCLDDNTIRHSNTLPRGWVKQIIYLAPKQES